MKRAAPHLQRPLAHLLTVPPTLFPGRLATVNPAVGELGFEEGDFARLHTGLESVAFRPAKGLGDAWLAGQQHPEHVAEWLLIE